MSEKKTTGARTSTGARRLGRATPWAGLMVLVVTAGCQLPDFSDMGGIGGPTEMGPDEVGTVTQPLANDLDLDEAQADRLVGAAELGCERHQAMAAERRARMEDLSAAIADGTLDAQVIHQQLDASFDEIRQRAHEEAEELLTLAESLDDDQRSELADRLEELDDDVDAACGARHSERDGASGCSCGGECSGGCSGHGHRGSGSCGCGR